MTDRLPHVLATTPDEPDGWQFCHEEWDSIFTSHENDECPARLRLRIEELEGLLDGVVDAEPPEPHPTLSALLLTCEQLPEAVLFECYGIERDCEAPLDKALLAWKDAGCPR